MFEGTRFTRRKVEIRSSRRNDSVGVLTGYAAVFYRQGDPDTEFRPWKEFVERIEPGAFDGHLASDEETLALRDHDTGRVLGRRSSGTLRLSGDKIGLRYEIDLPNTPDGLELVELVGRGDIDGSSFGFYTDPDRIDERWEHIDGIDYRTILRAELRDVGPTVIPAYEATTSDLRSLVQRRRDLFDTVSAIRARRELELAERRWTSLYIAE